MEGSYIMLDGKNIFYSSLNDVKIKDNVGEVFESISDNPEFKLNINAFSNYLKLDGDLIVGANCCPQPTLKIVSMHKKNQLIPIRFDSKTNKFSVLIRPNGENVEYYFSPFYQRSSFILRNIRIRNINILQFILEKIQIYLYSHLDIFNKIGFLGYRFFKYIFDHGLFSALARVVRYLKTHYSLWILFYDNHSAFNKKKLVRQMSMFTRKPKISIVMPVYNVEKRYFEKAIKSIKNQIYENWELCIADDKSTVEYIRKYLVELQNDPRIKVIFRETNGHISEASNSALTLVTGEYIALMDNDDEIPQNALFEVVKTLNSNPDAELIYSDEDKINEKGQRFSPFFKPDWSPDLFYSMNILTHLNVFKTETVKKIGGFRKGYEGSQDYDFCLRYIEKINEKNIVHIPKVLYNWRAIEGSVALDSREKQYAHLAARKSIEEHLIRRNVHAQVVAGYGPLHRVVYVLDEKVNKVSIIICTRDNPLVLKTAIDSILLKTKYSNYEIIIIDNGSTGRKALEYFASLQSNSKIKIHRIDCEFNFSYLNNEAVKISNGNILCFLNDDVEVINETWLSEMVSIVQNEEVGAVGAKLHYPNMKIQHFGIITGIVGGVAGHQFKYFDSASEGYFGRLKVVSNVSAVTGACLIIKKSDFIKVKGFDEDNLKIAYNDVDLCLKLLDLNLRNVVTPFAELTHYESLTRGPDTSKLKAERLRREQEYMINKWGKKLEDKYYNVNLSNKSESYELAWPPRYN